MQITVNVNVTLSDVSGYDELVQSLLESSGVAPKVHTLNLTMTSQQALTYLPMLKDATAATDVTLGASLTDASGS